MATVVLLGEPTAYPVPLLTVIVLDHMAVIIVVKSTNTNRLFIVLPPTSFFIQD